VESEARRIAHSLHDDAGHMLVSLNNLIEEMAAGLSDQSLPDRATRMLSELDQYLRTLSHELRPTALDDLGLVPALQCLAEGVARRRRISVHVLGTTRGRLPHEAETAAYRICQEALNNVGRHASASQVSILVAHEDNGIGFDAASELRAGLSRSMGLSGMRKRAAAVGGRLHVRSVPGGGTRVEFHAPVITRIPAASTWFAQNTPA
jgi:signal transduction histidine kinase